MNRMIGFQKKIRKENLLSKGLWVLAAMVIVLSLTLEITVSAACEDWCCYDRSVICTECGTECSHEIFDEETKTCENCWSYGDCGDNLIWKIKDDTLTISGSGAMTDYDGPAPWYQCYSDGTDYTYGSVVIESGCTSIGTYAFSSCDGVSSVTIPGSVTSIGEDAFDCCENLEEVNVSCGWNGQYEFDEGVSVNIPAHNWSNGTCSACELECSHNYENDACTICGITYVENVATVTTADGLSTTSYTSLENAISAAVEDEGSTITLVDNISMDTYVTINSGMVTIDLNGYCWESSSWALYVQDTANVTITDTSVNKSGVLRGTGSTYTTIALMGDGALTFSGGTIENTSSNTVINISDGGISNTATFTMDGGTLKTSGSAIVTYGESVTITGGTIESEEEDIYWMCGTIVLSGHSSLDGIWVRRNGDATTTIADIKLPDGYVLADKNGCVVDDFSGDAGNLYSKYTVKKDNRCTVTFDANGGTCSIASDVTTLEGKLTSLPVATHESMYFKGWYDAQEGGNKITLDHEFTEDTRIYAQYRDTCPHDASDIENGKCICGKEYIYVELADSYEDGWDENAICLLKNGERIETMTITEEQEDAATYLLEYDSSANYLFKWKTGDYPEECSFTIYVAGDKRLEATEEDCSSYNDGQLILVLGFGITKQPTADNLTVTTNDENAIYQWYQVAGTVLDTQTDTLLTGEMADTLANPEFGNSYACLVTFSNGTTEASDVVCYAPVITTQPTANNPTVETNDTEATYQWYEVSKDTVDITMDNIYDDGGDWEAVNGEGWFAGYDSSGYYYFALELKSGDVVTVSTQESIPDPDDCIYIENVNDYYDYYSFESVNGSEYEFAIEVPEDGIWYICTWNENVIKATVSRFTVDMTKPLENEAGATLNNSVPGKSYACVVTFSNGDTETSKVVSYGGAELRGSNLTLNGNIGLNFFFEIDEEVKEQILADETALVRFTGADGSVVEMPAAEGQVDTESIPETTLYKYPCELTSKQMADTVTVQFVVGNEVIAERTHSVAEYAKVIITNAEGKYSAEAIALVKAMLNYGAKAQVNFGYNTENLANSITDAEGNPLISEAEKNVSSVTASAFENKKVSAMTVDGLGTFTSANLLLKSETTLNVYFTPADGITADMLTFKVGNEEVEATEVGQYFMISVTDIAADKLDDTFEITVTSKTDNTKTGTFTVSVYSYCYSVLTSNAQTDALKDTLRALHLYNVATQSYIDSLN